MSSQQTQEQAADVLPQLKSANIAEMEWGETRFDDNWIKVLSFRDGVVFELQKFAPDSGTFRHQHLFRQLRYILEGRFVVNTHEYGPGELIDFPENVPYEVWAPEGGIWIVVQLPGATTGVGPTDPTGLEYGKAPKFTPKA
ncbi:MAG: hypothetical protein KAX84_00470 [Burkholderiales bacterium]|nr:hypothetical protein [Burkholderiales bacterium]